MCTPVRTSRDNQAVNNKAFTLLELILVIVIIGLLAGLIAPRFIGKIGKSKRIIAKAQIEALATALEAYNLDTGYYPSNDQGLAALINAAPGVNLWDGPYLMKRVIPKDPWGTEYVYKHPGEHSDYDIVSYGRDGKEGGDDEDGDIVSWK